MAEQKYIFMGKTIFIIDKTKNRQTPWLTPISQRDIQMGILSPVSQTVQDEGAEGSFFANLLGR